MSLLTVYETSVYTKPPKKNLKFAHRPRKTYEKTKMNKTDPDQNKRRGQTSCVRAQFK